MFCFLPRLVIKVRFPLWLYLSQPLFDSKTKLILNPDRFWQRYQIQILEHSWHQASIQFLERCWCQPCDIPQSPK